MTLFLQVISYCKKSRATDLGLGMLFITNSFTLKNVDFQIFETIKLSAGFYIII